jgi:hypothetical protein
MWTFGGTEEAMSMNKKKTAGRKRVRLREESKVARRKWSGMSEEG